MLFYFINLPYHAGKWVKGDQMAEFTAITSQEELDKIINGRLAKQKESFEKKHEGFISPDELAKIRGDYDRQIADLNNAMKAASKKAEAYDKDIAERDAKIKGYETSALKGRIAHETGLPFELAGRLSGETEEDIRKDAESLVQFVNKGDVPPMRSTEPDGSDMRRTALTNLLSGLKGE